MVPTIAAMGAAVSESEMVTFTPLEVGLILLAIVLCVGLVFALMQIRQRANIRSKFGPEYDRTVKEVGSKRRADHLLQEREQRVASFTIKPLSHDQSIYFTESWRRVQAQFVDDPSGAVTRADVLLGEVMEASGYPVAEFEQRASDLSVHHPGVVQSYRSAHEITMNHARGNANTEDLRQAMIQYRALFNDLIGARGNAPPATVPSAPSENVRE